MVRVNEYTLSQFMVCQLDRGSFIEKLVEAAKDSGRGEALDEHRKAITTVTRGFSGTASSKTAWKRNNVRVLSSAPSIDETGLDFSHYGEGLPFSTPSETLKKTTSLPAASILKALSTPDGSRGAYRDESYFDDPDDLPSQDTRRKEGLRKRNLRLDPHSSVNGVATDEMSLNGDEIGGEHLSFCGKQSLAKRESARRSPRKQSAASNEGQMGSEDGGKGSSGDEKPEYVVKRGSMVQSDIGPQREHSLRFRGFAAARGSANQQLLAGDAVLTAIPEDNDSNRLESAAMNVGGRESSSENIDMSPESQARPSKQRAGEPSQGSEAVERMEASSTAKKRDSRAAKLGLKPDSTDGRDDVIGNLRLTPPVETEGTNLEAGNLPSPSSGTQARDRWRRAKQKLAFVHLMSDFKKSAARDLLENAGEEPVVQEFNKKVDSGKAGAAASAGGGKSRLPVRAKGRAGMEGWVVRQDKGFFTLVQDFYVACLKMPIARFLVGVFLSPIALGLFFTPLYLCHRGGLSFNGVTLAEEIVTVGRVAAAKHNISVVMNVFLYALSLSTTFGGSPVAALSPYCLCVANVNTLVAQFLFVFLSGAVFARMSQPSHPVLCSRKAIIRIDDFILLPSDEPKEQNNVFAVRLVLTGLPPCELVDAKICLTFRILTKLPSGSMFCSTQDLELVRPEVPYLRYGLLVRHVIDNKSPVYGHTMESLVDGDASFSLTIMGLEKTSMQPIFHSEDYFVCDGDVAWDADYVDFVHINSTGHRVLDHSKLDLIKMTKDTKLGGARKGKKEHGRTPPVEDQSSGKRSPGSAFTGSKFKEWMSKSTSFTRTGW